MFDLVSTSPPPVHTFSVTELTSAICKYSMSRAKTVRTRDGSACVFGRVNHKNPGGHDFPTYRRTRTAIISGSTTFGRAHTKYVRYTSENMNIFIFSTSDIVVQLQNIILVYRFFLLAVAALAPYYKQMISSFHKAGENIT